MAKQPRKQQESRSIPTNFKYLQPKSENQAEYIRTIAENDVTICCGPAGSGKTCIAVGIAVQYFMAKRVEKIVISRPVLESGEKLGALPGELEEKIKPYLVPIYDEFHKYLSHSELVQFLNKTTQFIEIAPLAYMRGRTFHNSFIILDEGQNCSLDQLKMFLTRIGNNSKMVITGDLEQTDLPKHLCGGLDFCVDRLSDVPGVGIVQLEAQDIVRNKIIWSILQSLK